MSLIEAKLTSLKTIEVTLRNDWQKGYTSSVYLRYNNQLEKQEITSKKRTKKYTTYFITLPNHFDFSYEYEVVLDRALRTKLDVNNVVFDPEFDQFYAYDGPLGSFYKKEETTFYVWAPTSSCVYLSYKKQDSETKLVEMKKAEKGVWTVTIKDNLELAAYTYITKINGILHFTFDPYAYSSTVNSKESVVIDLEKITTTFNKDDLPKYKHFTDYIIYETSIRDFTVQLDQIKERATFTGFIKEDVRTKKGLTAGIDYLEELGITHVQIMPFYDFGSTLEESPLSFYNWGYDPVNYNVPEGGYSSNVYDPYHRITEVQNMVKAINKKGIHINMDVVYNHMFDMHTSCFHNLVPNYYFRYDKNGFPSNGSFCGNDTESLHYMMRRFIVDSIKRWVTLFGMDGFRFDLMGIHDVDTMNLIREELDKIDPMIIVYGEGWHMPSTLKDGLKASIVNQKKVPKIAMFNDRFRDTFKGPHSNTKEKGFLTGNKTKTDMAVSCYSGTVLGYKDVKPYMLEPTTSINYASCHDNYTIFDQYMITFKDEEKVRQFQRFNLTNLFITQGIIFMHSGSEFFRTKLGEENSYNVSDEVNLIDWNLRDQYAEDVDNIKELIKIRKAFEGYRLSTKKLVRKHVTSKALKKGVIEYTIEYNHQRYVHIINATNTMYEYKLDGEYTLFINNNNASYSGFGNVETILVLPFSLSAVKR